MALPKPGPEQNADRNLLFGVLALQMDFVTREELIAATSSWVLAKQRGLDEILLEQQALTAEEKSLIAALVTKHLQKHNNDPQKSLAALSSIGSVQQELRRLGDHDLQASLVHVAVNKPENVRPADPFATQDFTGSTFKNMRFRILRPHAEGGLGKVSVAHDSELNREVAFKEIKPQYADDQEGRARFVLEAEITGGLEHPGIVPVYGLGQYADGRPFYAMRFIQGDSLNDALERFHKHETAGDGTLVTGERSVEFRKLLRRFIDVCNALEYAHCRGVLHRDLKPGNVMLGKHGETLVVDWGLARAHGKAEHLSQQGEPTLRPSGGSAMEPTQLGRAIGTPAFMSPEQAAGRLDQLGPATDVYSLGATLYMILTGQPPITAGDLGAVLRRVQAGDIPPAHSVNRQVPAVLDSICRKAMAVRPEDRYTTALALAEDIEHWLADEPVQAHRDNVLGRAARWTRKNRSWAVSGVAALVLVACVSMVANAIVHQQKEELEVREREARQLASANKQLASEETAAREDAEEAHRSEKLAHAAADKLAQDNARIAAEKTRIAEEKTELAGQNLKLAEEQRTEADKSRRLAEFLAGAFQAADPIGMGGADFFIPQGNGDLITARQILDYGASRLKSDKELDRFPMAKAAIMDEIGNVYRQLGLFAQAEPLLADALQLRRQGVAKDHPDIADSCHNLAWLYHERGDYVRADPLYREALAIREKMPGEEGLRLTAASLQNLAWMAANDRNDAEAEKLFKRSLEIRRKLHGEVHREVVFCKLGIAFVLIEQQKYLEALPLILAAQAEFNKVEENPHLTKAVTAFALGLIYRSTLGPKASEEQLRKALEALTTGLGPDNAYIVLVKYELASTLEDLGNDAEAEVLYRDALKIAREKAFMQHPRTALLVHRYSSLIASQDRTEEGKALWDEFLKAQRGRFGDDNRLTAEGIFTYAVYLHYIGEDAAARKSLQEALRILEREPERSEYWLAVNQMGLCCLDEQPAEAEGYFRKLLESDYSKKLNTADLLAAQLNLASALVDQKKYDAAEEILLPVREKGVKLGGRDGPERVDEALRFLIRVYLGKKDATKAAEMIQARTKYAGKDAEKLYTLAIQSARCAVLVGGPTESLSEADRERRASYSESAITLLKEALAAGLKDLDRIKANKTLVTLGEHPEFQKILGGLEKSSP